MPRPNRLPPAPRRRFERHTHLKTGATSPPGQSARDRVRRMAEEHDREERPFEPSRAPSWKGSSRDLVVNPPAFFKELEELVERYGRTLRGDPDEIVRELRDDVFSDSSLRPWKKLERANELLEGHGVESIGQRYSYINFGDTYDPSIIYDSEEDKFFVSTMGDVEEERATQAEQEGWDYWLGKEFRRDLENLCEDNPKALAAIEELDDEGLKRLFHEAMRDTQGAEFIHESDDSVAVHKLDKVVQKAYEIISSRTPNARRQAARHDPHHVFTVKLQGTLRGEKPITVDAFEVPSRNDRTHNGFEIEVRQGTKVIFPRGQLYYGIPRGHEADDNYSKAMAVELAAMKPGDTDDEYFDDAKYTDEQKEWAEHNGDSMTLDAHDRFGEF